MGTEESVIAKIRTRRELGLKKYGVGVERTDLSRLDWLRHAQEEAMDLAIYLQRLIQDEESMPIGESKKTRGQTEYGNIVRDAATLGVDRTHLWRVLSGQRQSASLLARYQALKKNPPTA